MTKLDSLGELTRLLNKCPEIRLSTKDIQEVIDTQNWNGVIARYKAKQLKKVEEEKEEVEEIEESPLVEDELDEVEEIESHVDECEDDSCACKGE